MKNKEIKSKMLNNGKFKELRQIDKNLYKQAQISLKDFINTNSENEKIASYSELIQWLLFNTSIEDISLKELESYMQMTKAKANKRNRIRNQVKYYTDREYKLVFATFTFDDEAIKLDSKYRKELITRALNKNKNIIDYIGNIDYGLVNEREHYHYILVLSKQFNPDIEIRTNTTNGEYTKYQSVENLEINYKKGNVTYELIKANEQDYQKVQYYLAKLTLHALKREKFEKMIYKRESPYQEYKHMIERVKKERKEALEDRKNKKRLTKIKELEKEYQMSFEEIAKNIEIL